MPDAIRYKLLIMLLPGLNAAIEAARAGQHGKGFAVVAEERAATAEELSSQAAHLKQMLERFVLKSGYDPNSLPANLSAASSEDYMTTKPQGLTAQTYRKTGS